MKKIRYCKKCLFPETKPGLEFNEDQICTACQNYDDRSHIDWDERKKELMNILEKYKNKKENNWDCIIPVSGGKDSIYQVVKMLEFGMNPLCVNVAPCGPTDIGRKNMDLIKELGVDVLEFTTNRKLRKKLNKIGLIEVGDITWAEHAAVFTVPITVAVNYNIPLIIWGENSQNEYGGPVADSQKNVLTREWLLKWGGLLGLDSQILIEKYDVKKSELIPFEYPSDDELNRVGVTGIFLGYYIPWNSFSNFLISQAYGMEGYKYACEGSFLNSENLDTYYHGIHDYFKFLKLGFGRVTDQVNMAIRRGMLTREEGLKIVKLREGKFPISYLGKPLKEMLEEIDVTMEEFIEVCDKFTNKQLFLCDENGNLVKDKYGNLSKINYDNVEDNI
ncbi:MAG: N-acetyl sugar amidotransferase [Coprobacillus cateniformis]|uniref:N-acetyl sugar amidotransferase n=1 Tax=Longibaculum muris TaxID=1796628 RepID=UPI003AB82CD5|nr:N-acetyl sugar amidotransferase [Coprobacillus cateniformis]